MIEMLGPHLFSFLLTNSSLQTSFIPSGQGDFGPAEKRIEEEIHN